MKVLILSDIHGNWPALQAVLAAEPGADQILCLGDLVNYGPQPAECVAWAVQLHPPSLVIQGNHDRAFALGGELRCTPANQPLAEAMRSATSHLLTPGMKRFLGKLQPLQEFHCGEARCVACHSTSIDPHFPHIGGQNAQWSWETDIVLLGHPDKPFVLVGHPDMLLLSHTHIPVTTRWGNTLVINPGSVGLPTDGDPRAAYAVWENGVATLRRAAYDVEEPVRAIEPLNLPEQIKHHLVERLQTGGRLVPVSPAEMSA
jgi:predicted phosphodiesterase